MTPDDTATANVVADDDDTEAGASPAHVLALLDLSPGIRRRIFALTESRRLADEISTLRVCIRAGLDSLDAMSPPVVVQTRKRRSSATAPNRPKV
jgi:hypothetical protein